MQKKRKKPKIIVIVGPTATGKSSLAVRLAKKIGGEIISADSRQVYKGLNIGTEKITKKEMRGIPHHLINVANPKKAFTAAEFKHLAEQKINDLVSRKKVPIIVGGTGFYIQTLLDENSIPSVPPNKKLRKQLEKKSAEELFRLLKMKDPARAKTIEAKNRRRLIRALEIVEALGKVPIATIKLNTYQVLRIGIKIDDKTLKERIKKRLAQALRKGLVAETKHIHQHYLSWKRIDELGLEYRIVAQYLRGKITKAEMIEKLNSATWKYAKRQKTWFKRDKKIKWFKPSELNKIEREIKSFLK